MIFLIFISLVTTTSLCMQNLTIQEIKTSIKNPTHVEFFKKNTLLIGGSNGFSLYDRKTETAFFEELTHSGVYDTAINNSKSTFAIMLNNGDLSTHCTKTGNKIWGVENCKGKISFTNKENQLVIHTYQFPALRFITPPKNFYDFTVRHQKTSKISKTNIPIVYHQTSQSILYPLNNHTLELRSGADARYCTLHTLTQSQSGCLIGVVCSLDGTSYLINYKDQGCKLCDTQANTATLLTIPIDTDFTAAQYNAMAYHPNNNACILLAYNNTLESWNRKRFTLDRIITLNHLDELDETDTLEKRLSFSPQGTMLVVALKNKCFTMTVPRETRYPSIDFTHLTAVYCAFKKTFPLDVQRLIYSQIITLAQ